MTPAALPTAIRKRIAVTGDCWLWTGASCHGVPMLGNFVVKRQIWHTLTGELLHQSDAVFAECGHKACVNPDYQRIGARLAVSA